MAEEFGSLTVLLFLRNKIRVPPSTMPDDDLV